MMDISRLAFKVCFKTIRKINRKITLPILIYHRVLDSPDIFLPNEPDCNDFDLQMNVVSQYFKAYTLTDAVSKLKNNSLPDNAICITFDDGYKDNIVNAARILKKYNMPATFFIATGYINNGVMWNDKIIDLFRTTTLSTVDLTDFELGCFILTTDSDRFKAAKEVILAIKYRNVDKRVDAVELIAKKMNISQFEDVMMTDNDIKELYAMGMEIGAHTVNHPILAREKYSNIKYELLHSKEQLEAILNARVTSFAYPNGKKDIDYTNEIKAMVKELGYFCAVSTNSGVSVSTSDLFELSRLSFYDTHKVKLPAKLLKNIYL